MSTFLEPGCYNGSNTNPLLETIKAGTVLRTNAMFDETNNRLINSKPLGNQTLVTYPASSGRIIGSTCTRPSEGWKTAIFSYHASSFGTCFAWSAMETAPCWVPLNLFRYPRWLHFSIYIFLKLVVMKCLGISNTVFHNSFEFSK